MNGFGNTSFLGKELGPLTVGQLVAIIVSILVGILLLSIDGANGLLIWVIVAIILYMVPHVCGAKPKVKAVYPVIFAIIALVAGVMWIGPAYVDHNSSTHFDEHNGITVDITYSDSDFSFDAVYSGSETPTTDMVIVYSEVNYISYKSVFLKDSTSNMHTYAMTEISSGHYTGTVTLDNHKLYYVFVTFLGDDGKIDTSKMSYTTLTGFNFLGDDNTYSIPGSGYALMYILVIFYLILIFTTLMRRKFASTRKKMEAQGRLYPQGYGRCTFCGAIVLPGEINCRKCGAYIDRPESMKPHKKDFFKCSACGAEVPADATVCPKCGAKFDGEENEVLHADGTVDVSTQTIVCPVCGKHIPANSERCPNCGKKFDE